MYSWQWLNELRKRDLKKLYPLAFGLEDNVVEKPKEDKFIGAHIEHCCKIHGCKYGESDCPVVLGIKAQSVPCEACVRYGNTPRDFYEIMAARGGTKQCDKWLYNDKKDTEELMENVRLAIKHYYTRGIEMRDDVTKRQLIDEAWAKLAEFYGFKIDWGRE